jgi:hypothetical protein
MSMMSGMTPTGMNLAGSIAGAARTEGGAGHAKAPSSPAEISRDAAAKQSPDDVSDAHFSTERDADGRQLYQRRAPLPPHPDDATAAEDPLSEEAPGPQIHAVDAFGDAGNSLDLDA